MCGISGYLKNEQCQGDVGFITEQMTDAIRYRGPDSASIWVEPRAQKLALGHRRLSILDLSEAGAQPMHSASGRYVIVYNGEIYNFQSLANELKLKGHEFNGHSDTEVLLAAFEEFGIDSTLKRLAGMFAFALYDKKNDELTLARDRVGKKPLYFGWDKNNNFAFGSELKSILAASGFEKLNISKEAVELYLRWRYVPDPYSIYQDVWKLPPSNYITLPLSKFATKFNPEEYFQTYWNFNVIVDQAKREISEENSILELKKILFFSSLNY